jgi:Uma2 family endonuclease
VKEYIIVDPEEEQVWNICFSDESSNEAKLGIYSEPTDEFQTVFDGLSMKLSEIFD